MARKHSNYDIPDLNSDWGSNPIDHLPQSGDQVQRFIRKNLGQSAGAAWFDQATSTLLFFNNVTDRDIYVEDKTRTDLILSSTKLNLSSTMYRVLVSNLLPSLDIQAATNQDTVILSMNFSVQSKSISDTSWTDTGSAAYVSAYIDVGTTGEYVLIPDSTRLLPAGTQYDLDVRQYLEIGSNRVKVVFTSESDETIETVSSSIVYNVYLSEMYIEAFQNTWYNAIVEGSLTNYKLGGFKIVGSLYKTLHIDIYRNNAPVRNFEKIIGTTSYVNVPYNFEPKDGLNLSGLDTGVYVCDAYLVADALESLHVVYNFMYVAEGDSDAQLVCVNNIAKTAYNYSVVNICDYAIYNRGFSIGTPHEEIELVTNGTPKKVVDEDLPDTPTNAYKTLQYNLEWLIEKNIDLSLIFRISIGNSSQTASIPIDNSAVYPAEDGCEFYMNAASRSNNDTDKASIRNEAIVPSIGISAIWENMSWVDDIDGWTKDPEGRSALLIPAHSKCTIPYQIMTGDNMTFEIVFRSANVSDYSENIITLAHEPTSNAFRGIIIKPTEFVIHSSEDSDITKNDTRGKYFKDEETNHLLITIHRSFQGIDGKNLVTAYLNGCKYLQFKYENGTIWENDGQFIIGSSSADVYVYSCRVYRKPFEASMAEKNYINSLTTLYDREQASVQFNSILNTATREIKYENVVNSNYNLFVIEMKNGASVPSKANGWQKESTGYSDFEMHFGEHPEWDFKLFGVETSGQGTTSMDYYRWNIRWRIDKTNDSKKIPVSYYDTPTIGVDGKKQYHILPSNQSKTVYFDGGANGSEQQHPAVMRITAKINQASSMQSHKIGATRAYNDLHNAMELRNEAQIYAEDNDLPVPTVAVYQYPAFGFVRKKSQTGAYTYEFIGLFTIGPDKGDKGTFGYNISDDIKNHLITLEGTDHNKKMAQFQYPWNNDVEYRASNECVNIVIDNSTFDNAWEVGNCYGKSTDKLDAQSEIQSILEAQFKPAYNVAWENSTLIYPIGLDDSKYGGETPEEVLENINAEAKSIGEAQFWIEDEYTLYYYDIVEKKYVADINLVDQLGTPPAGTLDEQNEWFKTKRRERFLVQAPNYWDIKDSAYHMIFCIIFAATDNFAKNTYPYLMKPLNQGGRWKWRQDDLDTIFDINNTGAAVKPYYIEYKDTENGSIVFAGANSIFWTLLYETFWNDYGYNKGIESLGKDVLTKMYELGGGENLHVGLVNFFKKYFWDNAQYYFPQSAYNVDANWKYEEAWLADGQNVDPLTQSLGRHLEAEQLWCEKRAIYISSLFKAGDFSDYSGSTLGSISFRPVDLASVTVTPTMWMYPSLFVGTGSSKESERTEEGTSYTFVGPFSQDGETTLYIHGSNYLSGLGDWKNLVLANQYIIPVQINAAKLRTFKIGDISEEVTTNVPGLNFVNTKCLETIDARNAESLRQALNLSACTRLRTAYLEGTNIPDVILPNGSKINTLHLSNSTNKLTLKNLKYLEDLQLPSDLSKIEFIQIENCTHQNAFDILRQLYNTNNAALQNIRVIWESEKDCTADDITMLAMINQNKKKDGSSIEYHGINSQGSIEPNSKPVIEGTVKLTNGIYTDDLESLEIIREEVLPEGWRRALSSVFGTLYIIYDSEKVYIKFIDSAVFDIAKEIYGDGSGVTLSDAAQVLEIDTNIFRNNTNITSFAELNYFINLAEIKTDAFNGCVNLTDVTLPQSLTTLGINAFRSTPALRIDVNLPNLQTLGQDAFTESGITKISNLGTITSIPDGSSTTGCFRGCKNLTQVTLPDTLQYIGFLAFAYNTALTNVTLPQSLTTIDRFVFDGCTNLRTITLPQSLTSIGSYAFQHVPAEMVIDLPNLQELGGCAFYDSGVTEIISLGNITILGGDANGRTFGGCTKLQRVILPSTLQTVPNATFAECTHLSVVVCNATTPPTLANNAFNNCPLTSIQVPAESVDLYKATTNWSVFANIIQSIS